MLTEELVNRIAKLKVADLADGCRQLGFHSSVATLHPAVPYARICGTAVTIRIYIAPGTLEFDKQAVELYELGRSVFRAVVVQHNEVPGFVSMGSGGARVAKAHRYTGWVVDGPIRDTEELKNLGFPVFGASVNPDSILVDEVPSGHSIHFQFSSRIELAGMSVNPGDIIVGDNDGVIVISPEKLADVVREAEGIIATEKRLYAQLDRGMALRQIIENSDAPIAPKIKKEKT